MNDDKYDDKYIISPLRVFCTTDFYPAWPEQWYVGRSYIDKDTAFDPEMVHTPAPYSRDSDFYDSKEQAEKHLLAMITFEDTEDIERGPINDPFALTLDEDLEDAEINQDIVNNEAETDNDTDNDLVLGHTKLYQTYINLITTQQSVIAILEAKLESLTNKPGE